MTPDSRSYLLHLVNSLDVQSSVSFFYPRLLPVVSTEYAGVSLSQAEYTVTVYTMFISCSVITYKRSVVGLG